MKYLLDTGVFLWALAVPNKLNRRARELLSKEREGLFLSAASSWEISVKFGLGKLELPALGVGDLPLHHQDPFDRILIVQARMEEMVLLTADRIFEKYPVKTFWCGT